MPTVTSTNPYNGNVLATYTTHTETEISELLKKAEKRFRTWRETPFAERKKLMLAAASELKNNKQAYAETITVEMGKPIAQATAEVQKCAWLCEYYAETAESHLKKETV
ncbi:MAG: aldehyde dehydrogenase family protein, partial [Marinirhabdus sp.]